MTILQYWIPILTILVVVSTIPFVLSYETSTGAMNQPLGDFTIPSWIKNNAGWWADNLIDDNSFVSGIQWLISNDVILLPPTEQGVGDSENIIPIWIKTTAGWWADDQIHDITFVAAIKYLINEGIMVVMEPTVEETKCNFKGIQVTCPDVKVEEVKEFHMTFNTHSCYMCTAWGYTGEKYYFQINTFDEYRGDSLDGVTINAKIISKDGELRHNFGVLTTEDGIYNGYVTIPGVEWFGDNIFSVTGEYNGIEKTIEKEFEIFIQKRGGNTCHNVNPFDLSDWEALPTGITFSTYGSKMFVVGSTGDDVNEYTMTPPWCIGNAKFVDSFDISAQATLPQSIAFNPAGTKMFIADETDIDVNEYTLSTAWDVSTATFVSGVCNLENAGGATGIETPRAIDFNSDGTKMRVIASNTDDVHEFTLSVGFDVSECTYAGAGEDLSVSGKDGNPRGMAFNSDGTKMFFVGKSNDKVHEYTLSTAYDVSTATYVDALDISSHEGKSSGLAFDKNGHRMFIVGQDGIEINEYYLTVAWDLSTASYK